MFRIVGLFLALSFWSNAQGNLTTMNTQVLKEVEPSHTCMIKKRAYPTKQKAVPSNGKIYFACCAPCERTLTLDHDSHFEQDPVTGEKIDKATSITAADPSGNVLFFKNKETLARYNKKILELHGLKP